MLKVYLQQFSTDMGELQLSYDDVERIIGASLPMSAHMYKAWWANDKTHVHARSWLEAGWKVASVNLNRKIVVFRRLVKEEGEEKGKVGTTEEETIIIPQVKLKWSNWFSWEDVKADVRYGGVKPPDKSGVYEVKYRDSEERLTIGRASNLRMRVKQGLVRGKVPHSTGARIRTREDTSKTVIRWAVTDRPAAVEEELLKRHQVKFGRLPKYVKAI